MGIGGGTRDGLSVADIRPVSRGEAIAQVGLAVALGSGWDADVDGRLGASWFDFSQPLTRASGNIKDQSWAVRGTIDRVFPHSGSSSVRLGVGVEYGESRSWTDTRFYSDQGPRAYHTGAVLRVKIDHALHPRLRVFGELMQSLYRASAHDRSTATDFNWIGRSTALALGARVVVWRARTE